MESRDKEYRQNAMVIRYEIRQAKNDPEQGTCFEEIRITGMEGDALSVRIPESIEGREVTTIGKKAFLSCGQIEEIHLPDTVHIMEDWAFASCKHLRRISLKKGDLSFGKGIFKGCDAIREIHLRSPEYDTEQPGLGFLFAAGFYLLDTPYLADAERAGTKEWYEIWDARMRAIMEMPDKAGFSKMLLCGVEDYGSRENTLEHYVSVNRAKKSRIAILRLRYPYQLSEKDRQMLTSFVLEHTKGCESEEAWEVLKEEYGDDASYYKLFSEIGAINNRNCRAMISDLGEQHTELKAYLLRESSRSGDFFDFLSL